MAFQAVPQGVQTVLAATQNGVPVVNVYNVDCNHAVTDADLETVNDAFFDWWQAVVQPNIQASYVLNTITTTDLSTEDGHQFAQTLTTDNAGGITTAAMAGNAAAVISWRTARIGRSYRGRTYLGGLPAAAQLDAQTFQTASAAGFATVATDLIDSLQALGYTLCVLSRIVNGVQRAVGVLTEIVNVIVDTKIDSQRRRTAN